MSRHTAREKQQDKEREMSVQRRMSLFQSGTSERGGEGGRRGGGRGGPSGTTPSSREKGDVGACGSAASPPPAPPLAPTGPPPANCPDSELRPYVHPSYCESLFTALRDLQEAGLLLDCSLQLVGNPCGAHCLVLAAVSHIAEAWLRSGQAGLKEAPIGEGAGGRMTSVGLRAVLAFAYSGETGVALSEGRVLEEVLEACRCVGAERLAQVCRAEAQPYAARERERSLELIRGLWERQVGCDIIVQADTGEGFPAHRVVLAAGGDYFRALLCGGLRESAEKVVCLRGVAAWVLKALLSFVYSGRLQLGWACVWDLAEAALQFQLQGALSLCLAFLQERMDAGSCLDSLALAEAYGLERLGRAAEEYTLAHFQRVSVGEKFRDLPCPVLERLLERDSLCADSEGAVFRAVVCWVEEDQGERLVYLPGLLQRVRLPLMSRPELQEVQHCGLLAQAAGGRAAREAAFSLLQGGPENARCKPRTPNQVLVLVGGDCVDEDFARREQSPCLWFAQRFLSGPGLIKKVEWRLLSQMPKPARFRHCVCVLNSQLYILGGCKYYGALDILKSAVRFDLAQGGWMRLPDMSCPRQYFAAVCLGGKVFALGGNRDDTHCLDSVEYYTPEDNTWRFAHPLDTALYGHTAAVLDGEIFVSGGCDAHLRCLPSLWHYDPARGCSARAPMASGVGRAGHAMLVLGGRLVVAGGLQPLCSGFGDQLRCEAYDPARNAWAPLPPLPRAHLFPGAAVLDGQLYLLGGYSADSGRDTPWVHRYDPRQHHWDKLGAMPRPYADLAACTLQLPVGLRG